jgi:hypothetical protein
LGPGGHATSKHGKGWRYMVLTFFKSIARVKSLFPYLLGQDKLHDSCFVNNFCEVGGRPVAHILPSQSVSLWM